MRPDTSPGHLPGYGHKNEIGGLKARCHFVDWWPEAVDRAFSPPPIPTSESYGGATGWDGAGPMALEQTVATPPPWSRSRRGRLALKQTGLVALCEPGAKGEGNPDR